MWCCVVLVIGFIQCVCPYSVIHNTSHSLLPSPRKSIIIILDLKCIYIPEPTLNVYSIDRCGRYLIEPCSMETYASPLFPSLMTVALLVNMFSTNPFFLFAGIVVFVSRSERFQSPDIQATLIIDAACASRTLW